MTTSNMKTAEEIAAEMFDSIKVYDQRAMAFRLHQNADRKLLFHIRETRREAWQAALKAAAEVVNNARIEPRDLRELVTEIKYLKMPEGL